MKREVDVLKLASMPLITAAIPRIKGADMYYVKYDCNSVMEQSNFSQLMQPVIEEKVNPQILIIPAVALSLQGYRLGFGKGYYDKYISENQSNNTIKIGAIFHQDLKEFLPKEPHDLLLDYIITDQIIIKI